MLVFGVAGFFMRAYQYNVVPIVLGLILGPIAEEGLSQALTLNQNSLSLVLGSLFTRPICVVLMIYGYFRCISILYRMESGEEKRNEIKR